MGIIGNGSLTIKVRVLVDNYKIINSPRYNKMLERRKLKEFRSIGIKEDKIAAGHAELKKKKQLKTKKISSSVEPAAADMEQMNDEKLPNRGENQVDSNMNEIKPTLMKNNGDERNPKVVKITKKIPTGCVQDVCQPGECENPVEDTDGECECFKRDICRSLSTLAVSRDAVEVDPEDCQEGVEKGKTIKDVAKKRKVVIKCYLPSCNEKARHRCSRCLGVRYCSQGCNDHHWAVHRLECRHMEERVNRDREAGLD